VHVALPLSWNDLKARPDFSVVNFGEWKKRLSRDPWAKMWDLQQSLTEDAIRSVTGEG
jgi:bifunctional non-homologous end joining protein LigD